MKRIICISIIVTGILTVFAASVILYLFHYQKYILIEVKSNVDSVLFSMMGSDKFMTSGEPSPFYNGEGNTVEGYIAHAGGAIDGRVYTNSREAFLNSINSNYRFIELDLLETDDGHIIAAHDWNYLARATGISKAKLLEMSVSDIKKLKIEGKYSILDGEEICSLMRENPHFILVTDKITNYELLINTIPFPDRMIVETFHSWQYAKALDCGIKYPAFCLSRHECLLDVAMKYSFPIVTVDGTLLHSSSAKEKLRQIHQNKTCIMLYCGESESVDNINYVESNLGSTCSKIYTNFLTVE